MENNNIQNTSTAIGWMEKLLELAKKYTFWNWVEVFTIITIVCILITIFTNPLKVVNYFTEAAEQKHIELLEYRSQNTAEVQHISDRLLYKLGADRVVLLELHNNTNSLGGLPFLKATCTFEALNDSIYPIASQYQQVQLSLVPFARYLGDNLYWNGRTEELKTIDRSLAYRMLSNGTEYFSAITISGTKGAIGFLFVSWCNSTPPSPQTIQTEMEKAQLQIGVLLELKEKNKR